MNKAHSMAAWLLAGVLTAGLITAGAAYAGLIGGASPVSSSSGTTSLAIGVDTTIYSESFELNRADVFGVWVKATSVTGTPAVKIEMEESFTRPTTEGSGDTNWIEPAAVSDIVTSLTDETAHIYPLSPVPMPYGRYKITSTAANPADTVITMYNFFQGNN